LPGDGWFRQGPYERLVTPEFVLSVLVGDDWSSPVDVSVEAGDGVRRHATSFTLDAVGRIFDSYTESGECLAGAYFWAANPVFVRTLDRGSVEAVVRDLITSGELAGAFAAEEAD
jgi:hypothetical protein